MPCLNNINCVFTVFHVYVPSIPFTLYPLFVWDIIGYTLEGAAEHTPVTWHIDTPRTVARGVRWVVHFVNTCVRFRLYSG